MQNWRPTAYLIDFDGTLADTLPALYRVYVQFMEEQGREASREEFQSLLGPSLPEVVLEIQRRHNLESPKEKLLLRYQELIKQVYFQGAQPNAGVESFLKTVSARGDVAYIVTSAPGKLVSTWLQKQGLDRWIAQVVSPEGLEASKPDPAIYLRALEVGSVAAEQALAIEDTVAGASSALAAGIRTLFYGETESPGGLSILGPYRAWEDIESWAYREIGDE